MMKLQQKVVTTTTAEVEISPALRRKLLAKLDTYADLARQRKALKVEMAKMTGEIGAIRESTGETSIDVNGFKITKVSGTQKKLNKKKLVELGCALAWIEEATEEKPKRAYEKITCPGDEDEEDE